MGAMSKTAYIIGMGPSGLASALSLLSVGYSIVLIDRRDEEELFDRRQGIFLTPETITDFFSLSHLSQLGYSLKFSNQLTCSLISPEDKSSGELSLVDELDLEFFKLIEAERSLISIGELQRYQLDKLNCIYIQGGFTFQHHKQSAVIKLDKPRQKLTTLFNTNVLYVDAKKQKLMFNKNDADESDSFDILVDASGKTSKSFSQLWNLQNPEFAIKYQKIDNPHKAFGVVYMSISNPPLGMIRESVLTPFGMKNTIIPLEQMSQLKDFGWESEQPPLVYFKYSKEKGCVYITGEIPHVILDKKDNQKLKLWFDLVMQLVFNNTDFKTNDVSLASQFALNIEIADKYVTPLPDGGFYCLVGDALMSSNLLLGTGIKNAIADASELRSAKFYFVDSERYQEARLEDYNQRWSEFEHTIEKSINDKDMTRPREFKPLNR
jgi:hypothetical protein